MFVCLWWYVLNIKETLKENTMLKLHTVCPLNIACSTFIGTVRFPLGAPRDAEALPMGPCFFSSSHQTYTSPNYSVNTEWSYLLWVVLYAEGLLCFPVNCASFQESQRLFDLCSRNSIIIWGSTFCKTMPTTCMAVTGWEHQAVSLFLHSWANC